MNIRSILNIRDFRLLWLGQIISNFGNSMTNLALLLLINHLTSSTTALAIMSIFLAVPTLTFGLVAGAYVDYFGRRKVMLVSDFFRGILVLGFIFVDTPAKIWMLYLIAFIQAAVGTFFNPARNALVPNIVPEADLIAANSLIQTTEIFFGLLGIALAGAFIGIMDIYWPIFLLDALTFMISFLFIVAIKFQEPQIVSTRLGVSALILINHIKEGLKITINNRILIGTIIATAITMLGLGAVNILLIPFVINDLQVPETWFVAIEFSQATAMILSGSFIVVWASYFKPTQILTFTFIGIGLFVSLIAMIKNIWHLLPIIFVIGWLITPLRVAIQTISQTNVPDRLRGRTSATNNALIATTNLISMAVTGIVADIVGIRVVFILSGVLVTASGLLTALYFRSFKMPNPAV